MVIYETISGNPPFHEHVDMTVFVKVLKGEHPSRGTEFTESLWKMLEMCWTFQPNNRPSIEDVLQRLELISIPLESPPGASKEMKKGGDDWDESAQGPSDVPDGMSGTTKTGSTTATTATSFDSSYADISTIDTTQGFPRSFDPDSTPIGGTFSAGVSYKVASSFQSSF